MGRTRRVNVAVSVVPRFDTFDTNATRRLPNKEDYE